MERRISSLSFLHLFTLSIDLKENRRISRVKRRETGESGSWRHLYVGRRTNADVKRAKRSLERLSVRRSSRCQSPGERKSCTDTKRLYPQTPDPGPRTLCARSRRQCTCGNLYRAGLEVPSLCPYCVITALLSPCGSIMTDCCPGTEREVSHNIRRRPRTAEWQRPSSPWRLEGH